jgi:RNA polymerase sigma-70 factor (ECF subfamily)
MEDRRAEEQRLVEAVLRGEEESFAPLVARYQGLVASVARRYGMKRDDIEDVVSEVFIKTFRQLGRYRPEHPFSTWLYRLAVNHVVDHTRRLRRERGRVAMPDEVVDRSPGVSDAIESRERDASLWRAIEGLAPHYREVLFLVYVEGLKIEEVSRTLSVPTGTIKTRLMRGRNALRALLVEARPEHFGG